jgi:DNA-binding NarL/FixJ family response regulator
VALAHDAAEAAAQLLDTDVRVALIDMKLPGSHGTEVFDLVREVDPNIRTVLITGWRSELNAIVAGVLAEGADAAWYKPFDVPRLLETLDRLARATK